MKTKMYPFAINNNVLDASNEKRLNMREMFEGSIGTADKSGREGRVVDVVSLVRTDGINGLLLVRRQDDVGRVDCYEHLLPIGVVEAAANEHALPFVQQTRVKIQFAID